MVRRLLRSECLCPPRILAEILMSKVIVLKRRGLWGGGLDQEGKALVNEINVSVKGP